MQSIHIHFLLTRQFLSSSVLIRIYKQFIQPIYHYGALVQGVANKTSLKICNYNKLFNSNCVSPQKNTSKDF